MKIWYIVSAIDKSLAFEWISQYLNKELYDLHFILLNSKSSRLEKYLLDSQVSVERLPFKHKADYPFLLCRLYFKFIQSKPDVIHTHLPDASLLGLMAGWIARIRRRIYTRHHSTFHHKYEKKGVIKDRLLNYLATDIVAISHNVKDVLLRKEHAPSNKLCLIPHGFDLEGFSNRDSGQIERMKNKYNSANKWPVIGVISRWIEWKGIQHIIEAFKMLLQEYPNSYLILTNCGGSYRGEIEKLLNEIPKTSYVTIKFEEDIFSLYHLFDMYIHTPIDPEIEAFGQTYVEALAAGVPSIFTLSGIANELIIHERNALVVPFENSEAIFNASLRLLRDQDLMAKLIENGQQDVKPFRLSTMINKLEDLYNA